MSDANRETGSYSADVRMHLSVNGHIFAIGQLGPDFLILRNAAEHPPADGEITFSIDGRVRRWPVHLPDGVRAEQGRTRIVDGDAFNGSAVE